MRARGAFRRRAGFSSPSSPGCAQVGYGFRERTGACPAQSPGESLVPDLQLSFLP